MGLGFAIWRTELGCKEKDSEEERFEQQDGERCVLGGRNAAEKERLHVVKKDAGGEDKRRPTTDA